MILDDELRIRLPPIHTQEAEDDPYVYARFYLPGTDLAWYPIEGQPLGSDFLFFGFTTDQDRDFCSFRLSELTARHNAKGDPVERDATFIPGKLTHVVQAADF